MTINKILILSISLSLISLLVNQAYAVNYNDVTISSSGNIFDVLKLPDQPTMIAYTTNSNSTYNIKEVDFLIYANSNVNWDDGKSILTINGQDVRFSDLRLSFWGKYYQYTFDFAKDSDTESINPIKDISLPHSTFQVFLSTNLDSITPKLPVQLQIHYDDGHGKLRTQSSNINYISSESSLYQKIIDQNQVIEQQNAQLILLQQQYNKLIATEICAKDFMVQTIGGIDFLNGFQQCLTKVLGVTQ
jgi:hypothetical protein